MQHVGPFIYSFHTDDNYISLTPLLSVAGTVRLFFWPTSNTYTYPSTYVETALDYTFTSPSVYLVINTIYGTNSLGRAGPSGTSEIFAVDLDQVSTLVPSNGATRQLTLNDLYTNCPQSADPSVIATTTPDGHCDFSLLAPETVKQWALPVSRILSLFFLFQSMRAFLTSLDFHMSQNHFKTTLKSDC
jgi:hypothetical protein